MISVAQVKPQQLYLLPKKHLGAHSFSPPSSDPQTRFSQGNNVTSQKGMHLLFTTGALYLLTIAVFWLKRLKTLKDTRLLKPSDSSRSGLQAFDVAVGRAEVVLVAKVCADV